MIADEDYGICRWCGEPIIRVHYGAWVDSEGEEDCPDRPRDDPYQDHEPTP